MRKNFITSKSNADVLELLVEPAAEHVSEIYEPLPRRIDGRSEAHNPQCHKAQGARVELSPIVALLKGQHYARCCPSWGWDALIAANSEERRDAARDILLAREARREHVRMLSTSEGPYHAAGNGGSALQVLYKSGQLVIKNDRGAFRPLIDRELAAMHKLALEDLRHPASGIGAQLRHSGWRGQMFAEAAISWAHKASERGLAVIPRSRIQGEHFTKVAWLSGEVLAQSGDLMLVATGAEMIKLIAQGTRGATPLPAEAARLGAQVGRLTLMLLESRDITVKAHTSAREAEATVAECVIAAQAALA